MAAGRAGVAQLPDRVGREARPAGGGGGPSVRQAAGVRGHGPRLSGRGEYGGQRRRGERGDGRAAETGAAATRASDRAACEVRPASAFSATPGTTATQATAATPTVAQAASF